MTAESQPLRTPAVIVLSPQKALLQFDEVSRAPSFRVLEAVGQLSLV